MANVVDIAKAVGNYTRTMGINIDYVGHTNRMIFNYQWYKGITDWHKFQLYNGIKHINVERKTLRLAKTCCEDWASMLMNEKNKITLKDKKATEYITALLKEQNFINNARLLIELVFALGGGAFAERYDTEEQAIKIDFIHGDLVFPMKWENGKIIDCGFATIGQNTTSGDVTYKFITHTLEVVNGVKQYVIREVNISKEGKVVNVGSAITGIDGKNYNYEILTGSDIPMFQYLRPNVVNAHDKTSPFGVSIFSDYIDTLKQIDEDYDALFTEIENGKKRLFVKSSLNTIQVKDATNFDEDDDGGIGFKNAIDVNDTQFYSLGDEWDNNNPPIWATDWVLNIEPIIKALNANLDIFSNGVGLGVGFYNFNGALVARTATEIISMNSKLYKSLVKHEGVLEFALKGVVRALLQLSNTFKGTAFDVNQDISIDFDDSILEDSGKKRQDLLALYNAGLIDKVEFFAQDRFGGNRKLAMKLVKEMQETETMREMITFGGENYN